MSCGSTQYMVYWHTVIGPQCEPFDDLIDALQHSELLRRKALTGAAISFITMTGENPNQVGQNGVAAVENGVTPDGSTYDWVKRRSPRNG